ncbi:hypothetical protein SNE40_001241 [Patella caerulea]|uniref:Phosphatidylinositol N-acetylglucosaminyltransferase subunit C n=1 Tax=Patella caerulea TaxID=87958 RepID=A0AAN8Q7X6_PATCE
MASKEKWEKVLYKKQNVPDNYVDDSFLRELKKNSNLRRYDYWTTVSQSGSVTQQISSVCIFLMIFIYMDEKQLLPETLFYTTTILTVISYGIYCWLKLPAVENKRTSYDDIKTGVMFLCFLYGLSPVIVSLTETISTDTIYAMTFIMLLTNIVFYDYSPDDIQVARVKGTLSLNAATFASVCLASRLNTTWHAFAIVTFSFEWFALWPLFTQLLKVLYPASQNILTVLLGVTSLILLSTWTTVATIVFLIVHLFINFFCPFWLIRLLPYKNNIKGQWDEAEIQD